MFPRRSGIRAPEPREWILGALYLPVFLFFLNFAILTYFPALGFPLTEPRNYFFANLLYMTVNFAVMLLIFRRTLWQSLREFEGKMLLSVLIGFGMCYGANLVLTTAYTVLDIMPAPSCSRRWRRSACSAACCLRRWRADASRLPMRCPCSCLRGCMCSNSLAP